MKSIVLTATALALLAGCAQQAEDITASAVSPFAYERLSCAELDTEARRVARRLEILSIAQDEKAKQDAQFTSIGMILFWPALFMVEGNDQTAGHVAQLKGEMVAMRDANRTNDCGIAIVEAG